MIEIDPRIRADRLDQPGEIGVQPVLADTFVIERRQCHDGRAAHVEARAGQARRVGHVRQTGARNHSGRIDTSVDERLHGRDAFVDADRQRLTRGAERCDSGAALLEEPVCVRRVEIRRDRHVVIERRQHRHDPAADPCNWHAGGSPQSSCCEPSSLACCRCFEHPREE